MSSGVGSPMPRQIGLDVHQHPVARGYYIQLFIPNERMGHRNAIGLIAEEILYAAECEASKSFWLFDQYGRQVEEMGS